MKICLVTNGTLLVGLTIPRILPHLSFLRFSNLEGDQVTYARTNGCGEQDYEKVIDAIETAVAVKKEKALDTVITCTVTLFDYNVSSVYETVRKLKNMGVDIVHIKIAGFHQNNMPQGWDPRLVAYTLYTNKENILRCKELETENFKVNARIDYIDFYEDKCSKSYDKCYGIEFSAHIASDAKVYPCYTFLENPEYCYGDLNVDSFETIWKSDRRKKVLEKFYSQVDNKKCSHLCKQHTSNEILWDLANPPLHWETF